MPAFWNLNFNFFRRIVNWSKQAGKGMVTTLKELLEFPGTDADAEVSKEAIAAPVAVEMDSDEAWQDFQDTQHQYDEEFAKSQPDKP